MATRKNSSLNHTHKLGYTEREIRARANTTAGNVWRIHCLNHAAHKHADKNPSACYFPDSAWYWCHVCDLKGFADDRDRANYAARKHTYHYSNGVTVHREQQPNGQKRIWQSGTKEKSSDLPKPYGHEMLLPTIHTIYIVEGEKCLEMLRPHLDSRTQTGLTSLGGSGAADKTDWGVVTKHLKTSEKPSTVIFMPDCDESGLKYATDVANLLGLTEMNLVHLGGSDGYDIVDWLETNSFKDLPKPVSTPLVVENDPMDNERIGYPNLFGYYIPEKLEWLADAMIPARKLTLLVGRSGIGKSTMALYIASAISNNRQPFSQTGLDKGLFNNHRILIYSQEDDWNDTIAVRLKMMNADLQQIAPLRSQFNMDHSFDWDLPNSHKEEEVSDLDLLLNNMRTHPIDLLIIDPIMDVITGGNNNDPAVIRQNIEAKINPILSTGCTVLGIHHERKDAKKDDLLVDRAIGSQAWTGVARSVLHMQALPKRKAFGNNKNLKPRKSLDGEFSIKHRDMQTNSDICGVVVVSKSNLAKVDGGYHYELPSSIPDGQSSSFIHAAVNDDKITNRTAEELVQIYNPIAQEKPLESPVNQHFRTTMKKEVKALTTAEKAVQDAFSKNQNQPIPPKELLEIVTTGASVGERIAQEAIRNLTKGKHLGGNRYVRILK